MFKYLLVCLSLVAAAAAYDFKDVDFNEFLLNEFNAADSEPVARARRDADAAAATNENKECAGRRDWKKDLMCCKGDKFNREEFEVLKEAKKECMTEIRGKDADDDSFDPFDCEKMQKVKEQMTCVSECVAKKFKMYNDKGELDRNAILEKVRSKIGDSQWKKDNVEAYVDKCISEVREKSAKGTDTAAGAKGCSGDSLEFHHCLFREFSNGCPADQRIDTPKCNKMRERFAKGDRSGLNKHLLHSFYHSHSSEEQ